MEIRMRELCLQDLDADNPMSQALIHHLGAGGGRTRTQIALSAAAALGIGHPDAVALAAAAELLHNASLVQDDLQDRDPERRDRPAVWFCYGDDIAIGLTDLMISAAFTSVADLNRPKPLPRLIRHMHRCISRSLQGQCRDLDRARSPEIDVDECLDILRSKSGPLFSLGLELPLIVAGQDGYLGLAREAACAFAVGYQIFDDIKDLEQDRAGEAGANVVLTLEKSLAPEDALSKAIHLAEERLQRVSDLERRLPHRCGHLLQDFVGRLRQKLKDIIQCQPQS